VRVWVGDGDGGGGGDGGGKSGEDGQEGGGEDGGEGGNAGGGDGGGDAPDGSAYTAVVSLAQKTSLGGVIEREVPVSMTAELYAKRRLGADESFSRGLEAQKRCLGYDGRGSHLYVAGCERTGASAAGGGPLYGSANIKAAEIARQMAAASL
jgi:hypothetical protein